jgi:prepilin-type N-terminal cleavage/methylation domain-containing protein
MTGARTARGSAARDGRSSTRGATLIEVLVAVGLFGLAAAAVAQTLVSTQRLRATSERWMRATQLADERLERWRAGDRGDDPGPIGAFTRTVRSAVADAAPGLERIDVVVEWDDRGPQRFALSILQRSRP